MEICFFLRLELLEENIDSGAEVLTEMTELILKSGVLSRRMVC